MVKTNLMPSQLSTNAHGSVPADIKGIKAPVSIPNPWFWAAFLLGVLLIAAFCWWLWRRRGKQAAAPTPEIVIPPHEKARTRLREALDLLGQAQPFCVLVSDTIRVYLEERFRLHAPERTTEEFLDELQSSAVLTVEQKRALGEFLISCDLVKFARYEPGRPELQNMYDSALRLVEETEPAPPPLSGAVADKAAL
jgi:hypothetical protein